MEKYSRGWEKQLTKQIFQKGFLLNIYMYVCINVKSDFLYLPSPIKSLLGNPLAWCLLYPKSEIRSGSLLPSFLSFLSLWSPFSLYQRSFFLQKKVKIRFDFSTSKCTHTLIWGFIALFEECLELTIIPRKRCSVHTVSGYIGFQIFTKKFFSVVKRKHSLDEMREHKEV